MSTYCTRSDIEETFGVGNVAEWGKLSDSYSDAQVLTRITRAITVASEDIDDTLRAAGIEVPCVDESDATPTTIEQLCADLAGVWLYESRGIDDVGRDGSPNHRLKTFADRAQTRLDEILSRKRKINIISNTG